MSRTTGVVTHPPQVMGEMLAKAKSMECPFPDIWTRALQKAVKAARWDEKRVWKEALLETKGEWQAAYEDRETPFSHAFPGIQRVFDSD